MQTSGKINSESSESVMPRNHTVAQGECLSVIANKYGFRDYHTIYDDPANADFKSNRPNPDLLFPGDIIVIPDKGEKNETRATGAVHTFMVPVSSRVLRVALQDACWHRLANEPYQFTAGSQSGNGNTNDSGILQEILPNGATQAMLTARGYTWVLDIAHLNPLDADTADQGVSGAQGRLLNMGYDTGAIDGDLGPQTAASLRQFQQDNGLDVSGELDDGTRSKLIEVHGC